MSKILYQHTIQSNTTLSGVGLHTGAHVTITLQPANPSYGIKFQRIDIEGQPIVKADVDNVVETARSTTIEANGAKVSTIEHLMAAIVSCGIDNVLVAIDGPEIPILDGSAYPFIEAIEKVGLEKQDAQKIIYNIDANIHLYDAEKEVDMLAIPASEYQITTLIDFKSTLLGTQHANLKSIADFKTEIAKCRTFCFLHEVESLLEHNLIKGGDLSNAIVIADRPVSAATIDKLKKAFNKPDIEINDNGILNHIDLHYTNEPARHKLLDIVGDLALSGYNVNAHIIANKPGHKTNVQFAKMIKEYVKKNKNLHDIPVYDPTVPPIYDINHIEKILPHKYPFLLVDKIIDMTEDYVVGIKNVTMNENFFQGHFPDNPVMPGVLQIESMAQVGGILALNSFPKDQKYDTYFVKIDKVKFKQKVIPGDTLILKLEMMGPIRRGLCEMRATAYVGNKIVTEAELVAQIVPRK